MKTAIIEYLIDYDSAPLIHLRQDEEGNKYYCHVMDITPDDYIWAMMPISDEEIDLVKSNKMILRDLYKGNYYKLTCGKSEEKIETIDVIPEDGMPAKGITLYKNGV